MSSTIFLDRAPATANYWNVQNCYLDLLVKYLKKGHFECFEMALDYNHTTLEIFCKAVNSSPYLLISKSELERLAMRFISYQNDETVLKIFPPIDPLEQQSGDTK